MSTSETVTLSLGACPCGAGHIAKQITTQDNPWSSADVSHSIECSVCSTDWRLNHENLVLCASELGYNRAREHERTAFAPLRSFMDTIVADYLTKFGARTKKAEHAEMVRLGITGMSYRQYLEHRRNGGTASAASFGIRNESWLLSEAAAQSREQQLSSLLEAYSSARAATANEAKKIVRRNIARAASTF